MNCLKVCILGLRRRLVVVWAAEAACGGEHSNSRQQWWWWWGGTGNLSDSVSIQMEILASETTETTETTEPLTTDTEPTPLPRLLLSTTGTGVHWRYLLFHLERIPKSG